jgi:hypothetical protein
MESKEGKLINSIIHLFLDEANLQFLVLAITTASNLNNNSNPGGAARVVCLKPLDT